MGLEHCIVFKKRTSLQRMLEKCQEDLGSRLQGLPLAKHETTGELSYNNKRVRDQEQRREREKN